MSAKKQTKTSKKTTTKSKDKKPYISEIPLLPYRLKREVESLPEVARHPEIFEYIDNFEINKKYLLLVGGTKEEQFNIMEYVLEELRNRKLMQPDKRLRYSKYSLLVHKEVSCLNKDNNKLKLEIDDNVKDHKRFWEELLHDIYGRLPRDIKDDFYRYISGISNRFKNSTTKADYEIYKEISIEDELIIDISDKLKECRDKNESEDFIRHYIYVYLFFMKICKVLSLIDISNDNNEVWLGYTTMLMKSFSRHKPDLIMATLKNGERVKQLPKPFANLFEIISLDGGEKKRVKSGTLSKGKGFKIPKEKFIGTLKETYNWCKKEEAEKGEKWTGTKIATRAKRILKTKYEDNYDADFKVRYLANIISKIKKGEL